MAVFDPNLIAALTLRKTVQRLETAEDARARAAGVSRYVLRRSKLAPLTPEQIARLGRTDGLLDG
jgi:hypothetical protein